MAESPSPAIHVIKWHVVDDILDDVKAAERRDIHIDCRVVVDERVGRLIFDQPVLDDVAQIGNRCQTIGNESHKWKLRWLKTTYHTTWDHASVNNCYHHCNSIIVVLYNTNYYPWEFCTDCACLYVYIRVMRLLCTIHLQRFVCLSESEDGRRADSRAGLWEVSGATGYLPNPTH